MDSTSTQVYEDFVPSTKLVQEPHFDTLHLTLQGFKKEELRVELTKTGILKISGQRPVGTPNKWQRFQKELPVAENCDRSKISAKFENGILHVKQPRIITSPVIKDKELAATLAEKIPPAQRQTTTSRDEVSKQDNAEPKETSPKTSSPSEDKSSSSSYTESTDDETIENVSCLAAANMKKPRKLMKMTLVALLVVGIGIYVANVMKFAYEAEE